MKQPVLNLGDVDYIEHGGWFVFDNPPDCRSVEILIEPEDEDGEAMWTVYRFELEVCFWTKGGTCENSQACNEECDKALAAGHVLSDNPYHLGFPAWFGSAKDLESVAQTACYPNGAAGLRSDLCSGQLGPIADAYSALVAHYGPCEFDQYPLELDRSEVEARYSGWSDI